MGDVILEARGLSYRYPDATETAVGEVDLSVGFTNHLNLLFHFSNVNSFE